VLRLAPIDVNDVPPTVKILYCAPITKLPPVTTLPIAEPLAKTCNQFVVSDDGTVATPVIPPIVCIA
jgi:superfamily II helicase